MSKTIDLGNGALLDPLKLVNSRGLVCGNSGSGKSWEVRRLIEQMMLVCPIPTIVLDRDGDFATLREKFDFALIGEGGETIAHPDTAEKLARKLLELGVSAVVDFSDLKLADKLKFVRLFLEAMLDAPRSLWRPTLVVLDEAHVFAPEDGSAESLNAVISLQDQGRKRGYGGLFTTQRLAKLHKSAYAEANNIFMGRFVSDIDLRRCVDLLGFERRDRTAIRDLKPGEFFAMGPALVDGPRWRDTGVIRFATGPVLTTHPDPEHRQEIVAPQPSRKIKAIAGELAAIVVEQKAERTEIEQLRAEVSRLRARPETALDSGITQADVDAAREDGRLEGVEEERTRAEAVIGERVERAVRDAYDRAEKLMRPIASVLERACNALSWDDPENESVASTTLGLATAPSPIARPSASQGAPVASPPPRQPSPRARSVPSTAPSTVGRGSALAILTALVQYGPLDRRDLGLATCLVSSSGSFGSRISELRTNGWIERDDLRATKAGEKALGQYTPLPTGRALIAAWRSKFGSGAAGRMFDALVAAGSRGLSRAALGAAVQMEHTSGSFGSRMSELRSQGVVIDLGSKSDRRFAIDPFVLSGGRRA